MNNRIPVSKLRRNLSVDNEPVDLIAKMFPVGYVTILASKPGVGKTWFLHKLACDVSIGGSTMPFGYSEPERRVVYLSGETGVQLLNKRQALTNWRYNERNLSIYSLGDAISNNVSLFLDDTDGRNNLVEILREENPELLIIDTLISFHRQDESAQKEITDIYAFLSKIATKFDCAVLISHHLRKSKASSVTAINSMSQDEVIGTSAMARLASTVFAIYRVPGTSRNLVKNVKNWLPEIPDFTYEIKSTADEVTIVYSTTAEADSKYLSERILNFLKGSGVGVFKKISDIARALQVRKTGYAYLRELCKDLEKEKKIMGIYENSKWYFAYGNANSLGIDTDNNL